MLQAIGKDAQGKCFHSGNRFLTSAPVGQSTRDLRDFGNPPTIGFLFDFYG